MEALPLIMMGTQVAGGIAEKKAANKAAAAAQRVGEFNAQIIERDINLAEISVLLLTIICLFLTNVSVWRFVKRKVRL